MYDADEHLSIWNGTEVARGRLLSSAIANDYTLLLLEDVNNVLEVRGIILLNQNDPLIETPKGLLSKFSDSLMSTQSIVIVSVVFLLLVARSVSKKRTQHKPSSSSFEPDAVTSSGDEEIVPMSDEDLKQAMVPVDLSEDELTQVAEVGRVRRERRRMRARRDDDIDV